MDRVACALLGVLALGLATGCTRPVDIHTAVVDAAPLAQARTFSFVPVEQAAAAQPETTPGGYQSSPRSGHVIELIQVTVAGVLERKGYTSAPQGEGDLRVVCSVGRRDVTAQRSRSWRVSALSERDEERDFVEGGLVIDVFDRAGGQVWHGAATAEIDPKNPDDARVRDVAARVMEAFPARTPDRGPGVSSAPDLRARPRAAAAR